MDPADFKTLVISIRCDALQDALLEALSRKLIDLESQIAMMERGEDEYDDEDEDWY